MSDFPSAQELFLVLFSILFGAMLQGLSGLMPFPLGRIFGGYKGREDHVNKCEQSAQDRMRRTYNIRKIQNKNEEEWMQYIWRVRFILSFLLLNLTPILYMIRILYILRIVDFTINPFFDVLGTLWLSLNVFTFYRIYHSFIIWKNTRHFFCDLDLDNRRISYNVSSHILLTFFFYVLPAIIYLIYVSIYYN